MGGDTEQTHLQYLAKDLMWGTFAGVFMTLSGHPFDSLKVRMQTANVRISLKQTVKGILK
jgi:hypothetical protein